LLSKDILSKQDGITFSQTEIICQSMSNDNDIGDEGEEEFRNKREKGKEVIFLYRIVPGDNQSKSYGVWCASIAGLPTHIIERGNNS
jgi:DNA mismatch repair protein MSH5